MAAPEQIHDELEPFLAWLGVPGRVLEIGVRRGGMIEEWARRGATLIIGVDLPQTDGLPPGYTAERHAELVAAIGQFHSVIGDSHSLETLAAVAQALDGDLLDVLFIDGDHSDEGVRRDFAMYRPLVRPGGVVVFHDIVDTKLTRDVNCRPCLLWNELKKEFPTQVFEFCVHADWGGIGVLRV